MAPPVSYSLTMVQGESNKELLIPTVSIRVKTDQDLVTASESVVVRLGVSHAETLGRAQITLELVSHVDCTCIPQTRKIVLETASEAALSFIGTVMDLRSFIWLVSSPSAEWKCVVDTKTERIVEAHCSQRILH
jgi:hypothetical protein